MMLGSCIGGFDGHDGNGSATFQARAFGCEACGGGAEEPSPLDAGSIA